MPADIAYSSSDASPAKGRAAKFSWLMVLVLCTVLVNPFAFAQSGSKGRKKKHSTGQEQKKEELSPEEEWAQKKCRRGTPRPVLGVANQNIVARNFKLFKNEGVERAKTFLGDSIIVESRGCDEYEVIYTFKLHEKSQDSKDMTYWYNKAADLMNTYWDSNIPFDLRFVAATLRGACTLPDVQYNKEYSITEVNDMIETVMITNAGKYANGGYLRLRLFSKSKFSH